jgi:hypothetical protein
MAKRKQAPAASSGSLSRKSSKNVDDQSASIKCFPTAFTIVLDMLSEINKESYFYIYQVPLRPGQELYRAIGTFSHLFGLDENKTFEVLKLAGLVGIEGKQQKASFKTQQRDMIATSISGFFWNKYGKRRLSFSELARKD